MFATAVSSTNSGSPLNSHGWLAQVASARHALVIVTDSAAVSKLSSCVRSEPSHGGMLLMIASASWTVASVNSMSLHVFWSMPVQASTHAP